MCLFSEFSLVIINFNIGNASLDRTPDFGRCSSDTSWKGEKWRTSLIQVPSKTSNHRVHWKLYLPDTWISTTLSHGIFKIPSDWYDRPVCERAGGIRANRWPALPNMETGRPIQSFDLFPSSNFGSLSLGELCPAAVLLGTSVACVVTLFLFYFAFEITITWPSYVVCLTCGILPWIATTCRSQRTRALLKDLEFSANGQICATLTFNLECRENSRHWMCCLVSGTKAERSKEYYA